MPVKHVHSEIGVFEYIQDNKGIRYKCCGLARIFKCEPDDMRDTLNALVAKNWVKTASSGRAKLFFIRTEQEKNKIGEMFHVPVAAKPYRQAGHAWDTIRERLADFRRIPSIKITGENV
jgi:hypothetical protein